jgi:hypothetical protein
VNNDGGPRRHDLDGATADLHTMWPGGFDWQGAGVRLMRGNTCP